MRGRGIRPTGRGVVTLIGVAVIGVAAYLVGLPELIYAVCLALAVWLAGGVQIVASAFGRGSSVERQVSTSAPFVGEPFGIELAARGGRIGDGRWRDHLGSGLQGDAHGYARHLNDSAHYEVTAHRRGWHDVGPCVIDQYDVFAMWRRRRVAASPTEVLVLPAIEQLGESGPTRPTGDNPEQHGGGSALRDPDIIPREYRPGDPLSRIHWKATARRDQLMVRDDERKADLSAMLVLDLRRSGEADAVDRAVTMTVSVLTHLVDHGYTVRLRGLGCAPRIDAEIDSATGLLDAVRSLAVVEPGGSVGVPPRGGVRMVVVVGPRPRPWPVRAPRRFAITTGILTDADRSLAEPMGWRSAHYATIGTAADVWTLLGAGATGRLRA